MDIFFGPKYGKTLTVIFLAAFIWGIGMLAFRNYFEKSSDTKKSDWNTSELYGDAKNFFDRAVSLSEFKPYDEGVAPAVAYYRPPGYPLFLASVFVFAGNSLKAVIILQILIAALIAAIIADTGRILFDNKTGFFAGILSIIYIPLWNASSTVNSEILSLLYWALSLNLMIRFVKTDCMNNAQVLLSGLLAGMSAITRGQFLMLAPLSLLFIYYSGSKKKMISAVKWMSFFLLPVLAWAVYAYLVSGLFVIVSTQGLYAVWWGWSPAVVLEELYPVWNPEWSNISVPADQIGQLVPYKSAGWFLKEVYSFVTLYPKESFLIGLFKLMESWGLEFYNGQPVLNGIARFLKINWNLILSVPAIILLYKNKDLKGFLKFLLVLSVAYSFVSVLTAALYRYRFATLDIFFLILASYTVLHYSRKFFRKKAATKP